MALSQYLCLSIRICVHITTVYLAKYTYSHCKLKVGSQKIRECVVINVHKCLGFIKKVQPGVEVCKLCSLFGNTGKTFTSIFSVGTAAPILEPSQNQTVPVNSVARYACRTTDVVVWRINSTQLASDEIIQVFRNRSVQVDIENVSVLLVNATLRNNGTRISCLTGPSRFDLGPSSATSTLTVFGEWWIVMQYRLMLTSVLANFACPFSHFSKQIAQLLPLTSLCCHWNLLLSPGFLHSLYLEWFSATILLWPTWTPAESSVPVNWGHQVSTSVAQRTALPVMSTSSQSLPWMQQDWVTPVIPSLIVCHQVCKLLDIPKFTMSLTYIHSLLPTFFNSCLEIYKIFDLHQT